MFLSRWLSICESLKQIHFVVKEKLGTQELGRTYSRTDERTFVRTDVRTNGRKQSYYNICVASKSKAIFKHILYYSFTGVYFKPHFDNCRVQQIGLNITADKIKLSVWNSHLNFIPDIIHSANSLAKVLSYTTKDVEWLPTTIVQRSVCSCYSL